MRCLSCGFDTTDLRTVLPLVMALLQREGRVSYRALQYEFGFDADLLEALRDELVFTKRVARDEAGQVLVWSEGTELIARSTLETTPQSTVDSVAVPGPSSRRLPPLALKTQGSLDSPAASRPNGPLSPPAEEQVMTPAVAVSAAERRQLTVMFCDLVDSTALSGKLDPEDFREVVQAYQQTAAQVINRFAGHIAQYLGDGLLVYFGYPQAHEDDAYRAVRTGLEIIEAMGGLNQRLEPDKGVQLSVRLGIHTGLVVVGEMGGGDRHEQLALGETPNIAARLEGLATPNTVVISAATARLVQSTFRLADLGSQPLKGVAEPITVSRVVGPLAEEPAADELFPDQPVFLVGRDEEVGLLRRRWEQSKDGLGQVILLSGEAGIGKTSVVDTLRTTVPREGATRITIRCSAYHQNTALYPIIEHLQALLHWHQEPAPEARLANLEQLCQRSRLPLEESIPLFADLFSLPLPAGRYPALQLSSQHQKQRTQDALVALLFAEAEQRSVLATFEDLHWADPSTLELLGLVIDQIPTVRMLAVFTYRPEFVPPWPLRSHMTPLTLNRLERSQVEALITHLAGGEELPRDVVAHIVDKTDGVPLFVEELTKMVLESDLLQHRDGQYALTGQLSELSIPSTLHDSLMARLDRVPEVREVAQLGAVLGREFAFEVLRAVTTVEDTLLQERLGQLVQAELLYQRGRPPRAKYIFKHALIQDAAYTSLLRSTRQHYHQQIAQLFEEQFPEIVTTQPEVVAHHYTEGGVTEKAVTYWQHAGQQAAERSAHAEAIRHLSTGLRLLAELPDSPEHIQHELAMQVTLGPVLMATKGFTSAEVRYTYTRARELCEQVGDSAQLFQVLRGLWQNTFLRAELQSALEQAEQLLGLAQASQDSALLLEAHRMRGATEVLIGKYSTARDHLERSLALYDPQQHHGHAFLYGQDPGVTCGVHLARVLWLLGYPDQALEQSQKALTLARELAHPFSSAFALTLTTHLHQLRREVQQTQEMVEAALSLAREHGFVFLLGWDTMYEGWVVSEQGQTEAGIQQIRQGLADVRAEQGLLWQSYFPMLLTEAYGKAGQTDEAFHAVAEAMDFVNTAGEREYEAELWRLKGALLLNDEGRMQNDERKTKDQERGTAPIQHSSFSIHRFEEAEACFQQALDVARRQQAKSLELRAATSLAHLWQQQGKKREAQQLLSEIYDWFTEGFDTKDLQEAKALLEKLS